MDAFATHWKALRTPRRSRGHSKNTWLRALSAQSLEAWAAVPRLAARLTWLSALALLLASTWLYQQPKFTPRSGNETVAESLFDSPQSSSSQDDAVLPQERAQ